MTQKEVAINAMKSLNIYKPYIKKFEKDGTVTLFERFGGYYITEDQESELLGKIKEFEAQTGSLVYAVTHELFEYGDCYSFLCVSKYKEDWPYTIEDGMAYKIVWSWVWNKTVEYFSEFGSVGIQSCGGGIRRCA